MQSQNDQKEFKISRNGIVLKLKKNGSSFDVQAPIEVLPKSIISSKSGNNYITIGAVANHQILAMDYPLPEVKKILEDVSFYIGIN